MSERTKLANSHRGSMAVSRRHFLKGAIAGAVVVIPMGLIGTPVALAARRRRGYAFIHDPSIEIRVDRAVDRRHIDLVVLEHGEPVESYPDLHPGLVRRTGSKRFRAIWIDPPG